MAGEYDALYSNGTRRPWWTTLTAEQQAWVTGLAEYIVNDRDGVLPP